MLVSLSLPTNSLLNPRFTRTELQRISASCLSHCIPSSYVANRLPLRCRTHLANTPLFTVRRKEHALKSLYTQRATLLSRVPAFWSTVFLSPPEEIQSLYSSVDMGWLSAIQNFSVERYDIRSELEGEPRSLRFIFEFDTSKNEIFEDTRVEKVFEYKSGPEGGPGNLVSKAVPLRWKKSKKGKGGDPTSGLLDAAVELEKAEAALGEEVDPGEREGLWQYEKLREKIEKAEEEDAEEPSFLSWFGFRGAVGEREKKVAESANGKGEDEEDSDDEDEGMLDVEIFPAGEEVAIALAEDLWPNVMDYFSKPSKQSETDTGTDRFSASPRRARRP